MIYDFDPFCLELLYILSSICHVLNLPEVKESEKLDKDILVHVYAI